MINKNLKAVIFDMDGLLIDSMAYWVKADHIFGKLFGIKVTEEMIKYFTGRSELENMKWIKEKFGLPNEIEDLLDKRRKETDKIYTHQCLPMPGAEELLKSVKKSALQSGLASGSPFYNIEMVMNRLNWREYFDKMVSADHVNHVGKPDPSIYLYTADLLGVHPENCVVFEDAENGIVAAKKAGMKCVAVPNKKWSFGDMSGADLIVDSLENPEVYKCLKI